MLDSLSLLFPGEQQKVAVMHKPAYQSGGHLLIVEDIDPSGKLQVRVEDDGFTLMYPGEVIEQELSSCSIVRDVSPFVQDDQRCLVEFFKKRPQCSGLPGFRELIDQRRGAVEFNRNALLTGTYPQSSGEHRFACSGPAVHDDVFLLPEERKGFQLLRGQIGRKGNLIKDKPVKRLHVIKARAVNQLGRASQFPVFQFPG